MKLFISLLLTVSSCIYGQINLKGIVLDSINHEPVPYATVFINGTTKGTVTDQNGLFEIKNIPVPSEVVFSHVSYKPKLVSINSDNQHYLTAVLNAKQVKFSELIVKDNNLRKKNIDTFKQYFLGADLFGKNAILENDSVLIFDREYVYKKIVIFDSVMREVILKVSEYDAEWEDDSSVVKEILNFKVKATAPLTIDLPMLGYKVHTNLIDFNVHYTPTNRQCIFLGYYYFHPYDTKRKLKTQKYERYRKYAYYNSSQHFCYSLFNNKLKQNGYVIAEKIIDRPSKKTNYRIIDIDSYLKPINENEKQIVGLKNKKFTIYYSPTIIKYSKNLIMKKRYKYKKSEIYFLNDTCTVRSNGTIPDNSIMFGGEISKKKVGAFLPDEYILNETE